MERARAASRKDTVPILAMEPKQTFGRIDLERDYGVLALSLTAYEPGVFIPSHRHGETYLCLVVEGLFEERSGARGRVCKAGTLLVHPPGTVHEDRFGPEGGLCLNLFPKEAWISLHRHLFPFDEPACWSSPGLEAVGQDLVCALREPDAVTPLAVESLVLASMACALRSAPSEPKMPSWLPRVLERIDRDPASPLGLSALAHVAGVSGAHLARVIRARFHMSVGAYARERRLARAREMVLRSEAPLADIAVATGFYDQSHFTRAFKLRFGVPPSALRRAP
ncbi:MAG TPA: AraC family transcriptional regulator [Holophagaceae bacterium]|jgi:AraC family transcriptional regulator|nr:AraC family transcriptional regulator [Holophagaceae bacterium]